MWWIIASGLAIIISLGVALATETISPSMTYASIWYAFSTGGAYLLIYWWSNQQADSVEKPRTVVQAWAEANKQLSSFPGGVSLQWNQGLGRTIQSKTFHKPTGGTVSFWSFEAVTAAMQPVIVYFNRDDWQVETYKADPPPQIIENHYGKVGGEYWFNPYQSERGGEFLNRYGPSGGRYGPGGYRRPGVQISLSDDDNGYIGPDREQVDLAAQRLADEKRRD
jgi:hypothetical protein